MSTYPLQQEQQAKLDRCLDDLEALQNLKHESTKGLVHPFEGRLKKLKLQGASSIRPILVIGPEGSPEDQWNEITFLHVAMEKNWILQPSRKKVVRLAQGRLDEILKDGSKRARYVRD